MLQIDYRLVGVKELNHTLSQLPRAFAKSVVLTALKKSAIPVVDMAKNLASKQTGAGAKSIKARTNPKLKPIGISIGPSRERFYMMFSEFGTVHQAARPFLRPAWDAKQKEVVKRFSDEAWKILLKKLRTVRRKAEAGTLGKGTAAQFRRLL